MMRVVFRPMRLAAAALLLFSPALQAQGAGSTGATVLQFVAGARAGALSGAYTAASSDADVLFYNPAGAATLRLGASLSYETYVEEIGLASFAGAFKAGSLTIGLSGLFLDAGSVVELVPAPDFGGNTGMPTGNTVTATEGIARLSLARPFGERLRVGASAGFLTSSIADNSSSAPVFDLGAQYELSFGTIGAALRNAGGALGGGAAADADLPTEARLGLLYNLERAGSGLGVALQGDLVARVYEGTVGFVLGAEAGYTASTKRSLSAVARAGFNGAAGDGSLGALNLGGGIALSRLAIDYAFQNVEFFGAVHRFGIRWTVPR